MVKEDACEQDHCRQKEWHVQISEVGEDGQIKELQEHGSVVIRSRRKGEPERQWMLL